MALKCHRMYIQKYENENERLFLWHKQYNIMYIGSKNYYIACAISFVFKYTIIYFVFYISLECCDTQK